MSDHEDSSSEADGQDITDRHDRDLEDAAVTAIRECHELGDDTVDGAPREAVVDILQDDHDADREAAMQAILDAQMAGRAYMTVGPDEADQAHFRAPDQPDSNDDPRDIIATAGSNGDTSRGGSNSDAGSIPPNVEMPPDPEPPEEEPQPVREEPDPILDDEDPGREPEFPGSLSGESIRLRGDEDEEWREPRSLY